MDAQQIKTFIDAMASSDLAELEFSQDGWALRLVRRQAPVPAPANFGANFGATVGATVGANLAASAQPAHADTVDAFDGATDTVNELQAPLFGVVHLRPAPDEPPFVVPGQAVRSGQTLCVIEAMKVFNEVRAEADATVQTVLVTSGQEVEAGQALLRFV